MREYTVSQAAELLGISANGVRDRIARGDMRARRIGSRLLVIEEAEIERWRSLGKLRPGPRPKTAEPA